MIYVLARNHHEATRVAYRYALPPRDWRYLSTGHALRGTRKAHVIATDCWSRGRDFHVNRDIWEALDWSEALVAEVDCP